MLANDSDVDLDSLQAILVDDVTGGSLTLNPDGSFEYTPDPGFVGNDSFTYRASDSNLDSNLATVYLEVVSNEQAFVSDEFDSEVLDEAVWTFVDPTGDGTAEAVVGTANISVAGGSSHDIWTSGINAPRLMQDANNVDFAVEAKFDNVPAGTFAMTGILVRGRKTNICDLNSTVTVPNFICLLR